MIINKTTRDGITHQSYVYTEEEYAHARDVSLTSLASSLGYTPVRQGRHYSLKEMDSLVIYNDRSWHRWSGKGDITGGSQIDFMLAFGSCSTVPEAVHNLLQFKGEPIAEKHIYEPAPEKERREFKLPERNGTQKRLFAYLIKTRGLSPEVVSDFVQRKLIYEDAVHHNIVYCGYDPEGKIRYAGLRGTADAYGKKFKMDVPGNDKNYGVNIVNKDSDVLTVFESVIDCMSYIDLYGDKTSNKLVLGMVEDNPLRQFLKDYSHIKKIAFCLDNDAAGQKAVYGDQEKKGLKEKYEELGYEVEVVLPGHGKDMNEFLLYRNEDPLPFEEPLIVPFENGNKKRSAFSIVMFGEEKIYENTSGLNARELCEAYKKCERPFIEMAQYGKRIDDAELADIEQHDSFDFTVHFHEVESCGKIWIFEGEGEDGKLYALDFNEVESPKPNEPPEPEIKYRHPHGR